MLDDFTVYPFNCRGGIPGGNSEGLFIPLKHSKIALAQCDPDYPGIFGNRWFEIWTLCQT